MELRPLVIYSLVILTLWVFTLVLLQEFPVPGAELDQIQGVRTRSLDFSFKWVTRLGEIWLYVLFSLTFALRKQYGKVIQIGVLGVLVFLISMVLKVYFAHPRPALAWSGFTTMQTISGVEWLATWDSFPSGHTMSAVALAGWLAWNFRNPWIAGLLAITAGMVGFSRIYLAEHFLKDVSMGLITGLTLVWIYIQIIRSIRIRKVRDHSSSK